MATPKLTTIGDSLYWSYANLAMMFVAVHDEVEKPETIHYMIRAKLFGGVRKGTMKVRGFFADEKLKLKIPPACWYCGSTEHLSVDHVIPQSRNGSHGGENLISCCRTCNSSKGSTDLLAWMETRNQFPSLCLLRRYLKMVIEYCKENELMDVPLDETHAIKEQLPFDLDRIPHDFPPVKELCTVVPVQGEQEKEME